MRFIIGSGGHAKVVLDAMQLLYPGEAIVLRDGNFERNGQSLLGHPIFCPEFDHQMAGQECHVAIGSNRIRQDLISRANQFGAIIVGIIHPRAQVAGSAVIGFSCFIAAGAIVAPAANIGKGVIINHNAVVDHDSLINDFAHIGPGATLGGSVHVGEGSLIGAGANILPGVRVGKHAVVGAGSVVICDIGDRETWVGVPARRKVAG